MTDPLTTRLQGALHATLTVERELGGGGMARVFLARETTLGRSVVIKVFPQEATGDVNTARFRREILVAANLQHPLIVPLLSAGDADGLLYFTMPFVEGESLRARLERHGALPVPEVVGILRDLLSALAYAHSHGVVHRDIKPENLLLSGGHAVILDFGVARALSPVTDRTDPARTSGGIALGTPAYMAPEQAAADPQADHRVDLYAAGLVAYEMLAGVAPFAGRTPQALLAAQVTEAPKPIEQRRPGLPPALAALVARLLAKNPAERPATAADTLVELERAMAGLRPGRRPLALVAVLLALTVAVAWLVIPDRVREPAAVGTGVPVEGPIALGVMPFENLSGSADDAHFTDGLTEELIDALGRVPRLRVAARTSTFALRGRGLGLAEIGQLLGVSAVVTGSVRRSGDQLRVSVRLEDVQSERTLWSDRYDRTVGEVFALQDGIAREVATRLAGTLAVGADARLVSRSTSNPEAHDLVLQGRYALNYRSASSESTLVRAVGQFERALLLDSAYAAAAAGLAEAYMVMGIFGVRPKPEVYPRALVAARRAIAIDSTDPLALKSFGFVMATTGNFAAAEAALLQALAISPYDGWTHHYYALLLTVLGRYDAAIRESNIARQVDPLGTRSVTLRASLAHLPGHAADMRPELLELLNRQPNYPWALYALGLLDLLNGQPRAAIDWLARALDAGPALPGVHAALATAYRQSGRAAAADSIRAVLEGAPRERRLTINLALLAAASGDLDRAFGLMGEAQWDVPSLVDLRVNPLLAALRADSRYPPFMAGLGLQP